MIGCLPGPFRKLVCLTILLHLAVSLSAWAQTAPGNEAERLAKQLAELRQNNKYKEALPVARHILELVEKANGPSHVKTVFAVNDLATLYQIMGDYPKAEPLFQRSLKICELVFGPRHPNTATSLNNLARLHVAMSDYAKAEPLYRRSVQINETAFGPEHPNTATSLNNLATLYFKLSDYPRAEPLFQRNLKIREMVLGPEHPLTAASVNNLAMLYETMGDYAKAEPLYQRSLKVNAKVLGRQHPDTATSLNNLGLVCIKLGDYAKAEPLLQEGLAICEKVLGEDHPDTATSLNNLAVLYRTTAANAKAEPLLQRCLKISERLQGTNHPETATSLNNLALLYSDMGNYGQAEPLFQRSLKVYERVGGTNHPPAHPGVAAILGNLALLELDRNRPEAALGYARRLIAPTEAGTSRILAFASEGERLAYQQQEQATALLASLGAASELAQVVLRNKGLVLDSLLEERLAVEASADPSIKAVVEQLRARGRQFMQHHLECPPDADADALTRWKAEEDALRLLVEESQRTLTRKVMGTGTIRRALKVTLQEVQSALPDGTVLLEFVRYAHHRGRMPSEPRYGVLLIGGRQTKFKDEKAGMPVWVPLGSATNLDSQMEAYSAAMRAGRKADEAILRTLASRLFTPVQKWLPEGCRSLVICPDSQLNFLSFGTLVTEGGEFLAEHYRIKYVTSGRDLLFGNVDEPDERAMVAFANPAFSLPSATAGNRPESTPSTALSQEHRGYDGLALQALPGTEQEIQFLKDKAHDWKLLQKEFVGSAATEAELNAVRFPFILHLATHGFFLPEIATEGGGNSNTRLAGASRASVVLRNPMLRSGLALAGARNTLAAWKQGLVPPPGNDGILTAQEVGSLNLRNTWLVALSACDTGIGEARSGEGVLGLRRGFVQAGAQNLLMTLWPISDKWSVEIMKAFYEKAMATGDAPQAMADVQAEWLAKLRKEKGALIAARIAGPFVLTSRGKPTGK